MGQWVKAKRMSVFTTIPYGGNQAWVVLGEKDLSDEKMRRLACDLNPHTDTAFVFPESTSEADFHLRFFTGVGEINFSGYASIAAYFALSGENRLIVEGSKTVIRQRTKAGIQHVELRVQGDKVTRTTIALAYPKYLDIEVNPNTVAKFLGLDLDDVTSTELTFDTISVGFYDFIVPVKTLHTIKKIKPNFSLIDSFCARMGVNGIVVFCMETFDTGDTAFMRYFVPSLGQIEEPTSGASAASVGCYLIRYRLIEPSNFSRIIIEQGYLQQRNSKVYVHVECTREQIYRVKIGGNAICTFTGYVLTP